MLELLVVGLFGLAFLVILPLLVMKAFFGLLVGLIALPFKLLGVLFKLAGGLLGAIVGLAFGGIVAIVCVALCLPLLLLAVPLIPLLVLGAGFCLLLEGGVAILA